MTNFYFLEKRFPELKEDVEKAEKLMHSDPEMSAIMARKSLEQLIKYISDNQIQKNTKNATISILLTSQEFQKIVPKHIINKMHTIKNLGNKAIHEKSKIDTKTINTIIYDLFLIFTWFFSKFGYVQPQANKLISNAPSIHTDSIKSSTLNLNTLIINDDFSKSNNELSKGVWVDPKTKLMWARISIGQKWENGRHQGLAKWIDWRNAEKMCQQLKLANFTDWRLPTSRELSTIMKRNKIGYICPLDSLFKPTPHSWGFYWSSSHINDPIIQGVNFDKGCLSSYNYLNYEGYVRAVRNI